MAIIEPVSGTDYPTLPFEIQQSGYSTTNSNDFTATQYGGGPSRLNTAFLNGWKTANFTILFKDYFEQYYWDKFYKMDFNGTSGGLNRGVSPFYAWCQLGGQYGRFLCQLTNAEWQVSNIAGFTAQLKLTVEVDPDSYLDADECREEIIESLLSCSSSLNESKITVKGMKDLAENGMNPINIW